MTKAVVTEVEDKTVVLNKLEQQEIEQNFKEAKDFRSIGERITQPLDTIIDQTADIISKDPIMKVSDELAEMNTKMQGIYSDIIDNDGALMRFFKKLPGIGIIAQTLDEKFDEMTFNVKDINDKISHIFGGFDQAYTSLNTSIDMQKVFLEGIEENLGKVIAYKDFLGAKIEEFKTQSDTTQSTATKEKMLLFVRSVEFFQTNLVVLIGNLKMAEKRILIRLDSAQKLSLAMNSSKPIFKTLLSSAIIEVSGQKAIDASMKAMTSMGEAIDKMSSDLTDKAIEGNKKAEELSSKPILSSAVFIENVTKLKNHFEEIEDYRAQVAIEAKKEKEAFKKAEQNLENIKLLSKKGTEELEAELASDL